MLLNGSFQLCPILPFVSQFCHTANFCTSDFVDDDMFARNGAGIDAVSRAYDTLGHYLH